MSIIVYKYHNANLGPLLQICKCRVQSSSTVIYAGHNDQYLRTVFRLPKKEEMANMWIKSLRERTSKSYLKNMFLYAKNILKQNI